ncbi:PP2C family protein-serine/threonine phosphatase [Parendozoicomonas sp. Alg238-R29]|uniref:PP2C family serine/threonine-protein phosphatase n=1 Tax=Parendozoicomonas sp. Alg238-R29 TaxID=2993446 RepID=UPI00248DA37D|nr:PP2C family protein-serine/threonine phosphatase [Parendozoicomonas sp. Alg238-R29]
MRNLLCCVRPRTQEATRQSTSASLASAGLESNFSGYTVTTRAVSKEFTVNCDTSGCSALLPGKALSVVKREDTLVSPDRTVSKTKVRHFLANDKLIWNNSECRCTADYRLELDMGTINTSLEKEKKRAKEQQKVHFEAINQGGTAPSYMDLGEYKHVNNIIKEVDLAGLQWNQQDDKYHSYTQNSYPTDSTQTGVVTVKMNGKGHDTSSFTSVKIDGKDNQIIGVYDGHGQNYGLEYSEKIAEKLPLELEKRLQEFSKTMNPVAAKVNALKTGCTAVDQEAGYMLGTGTTACVAVVEGQSVTLLNVGDSRAVAIRCKGSGFEAEQLTTDQKILDNQFSKSTDKRRGKEVISQAYRTNKSGLARKFGDPWTPGLSARPKVTQTAMGTDDYLVIACDGIYDYLLPEQMAELIARLNERGCTDPNDIAAKIVAFVRQAQDSCKKAEVQYGRDDLTVSVTQIKPQEGR